MNPQLIDEINNLTSAIEDKNGIAEALIRFSNQLISAARDAAHEADDLCLCGEHESCRPL